MLTEAVVPLLSAFFGGVAVALLNYLLNKQRTEAEIEKIRAETDKIRAETASIVSSLDGVKSGQQKQEHKIKEIQKFLVRHFLTEHERSHLEKLADKEYWPFKQDATTGFFLSELQNLRSMNLIEGHPGKGLRSLRREGGDINAHFKIRPEGEEYLRLLSESSENEETG